MYRRFKNNRTTGISERSAKRFLKLFLGIRQPRFCFHQILTFCPCQHDARIAKTALKLLLDNLHHRFEMASLYVQELQRKGGIHYHVFFLFFDGAQLPSAPTHVERTLRSAVFSAWRAPQGFRVIQRANRLYPWTLKPDYLVKQTRIVPADKVTARFDNRWWGFRNRALIKCNSSVVSIADLDGEYVRLFLRPARLLSLQKQKTARLRKISSQPADVLPNEFLQSKSRFRLLPKSFGGDASWAESFVPLAQDSMD